MTPSEPELRFDSGEAVTDACVFPAWPGVSALVADMEPSWIELLMRPGDRQGPVSVLSPRLYTDPDRSEAAPSAQELRERYAEAGFRGRVVFGWDDGLLSTAFPYRHIAKKIVSAANDWLVRDALADAPNCSGMLLISSAVPEDAAKEIRRVGGNESIAAVAMGCNVLGRPFGDQIYLPIFEAATELRLPIVLQTGSDGSTDIVTPPVAGGLPATYGEYRALSVHSHMSHVSSMIVEGLFDRFPSLQVLLVGGGFSWVPSWLWRLNLWYKRGRRTQAPWLKRLPSEYFVSNVRVATCSIEPPRDGFHLEKVLAALPEFDRILLYASCYPTERFVSPTDVTSRLPESWREAVLNGNASSFFRSTTVRGAMLPPSATPTLASG